MDNTAANQTLEIALDALIARVEQDLNAIENSMGRLDRLMCQMPDPPEDLADKVDQVIKGVLGGKVAAKQVDQLHEVAAKSKTDRALGRAIRASRLQLGLLSKLGF